MPNRPGADVLAIQGLVERIELLEKKLALLNDAREIANLQGRYIYYLQEHQYDQIVELFAQREEVSVEMDNLGKFHGRDKVVGVFLKVLKPLYTSESSVSRDTNNRFFGDLHCMGRDGFILYTETKNVTSTWFAGKEIPAKVSTWDGTMTRG
jgi:hypothetical protein